MRKNNCCYQETVDSGYFDLRKLEGTIIHRNVSYKKLTLISKVKTLLFERSE